ncbi:MAG: CBS domain-containing protein, partial [Pseudomonadota bacterium]
DSTERLMEMMTAGRMRHLPVTEDGKLTGIISIGDVVKRRIADAELEAESLKAYIASG